MAEESISLDDYKHDMDELAQSGASIIRKLREDIKERERTIVGLLLAAGGSITVRERDLISAPEHGLELIYSASDRSYEYRARPL